MLELQKKYHDARMEQDKELYERQIKMLSVQIDWLVYDLYGLTDEEVKMVEKRVYLSTQPVQNYDHFSKTIIHGLLMTGCKDILIKSSSNTFSASFSISSTGLVNSTGGSL
jgi:hypothetical protein